MKATVIYHSSGVEMINRIFVRQSLKTLTPMLFLLLCCSIGAFAQSPSSTRELTQMAIEQMRSSESGIQELISFKDTTLKAAIYSLGTESGLDILFDEAIKDSEMVNVELNDTTFGKAMDVVLLSKRLQAAFIAEKTIIIFPENEENRKKYEQYEFWLPPWRPTYCGNAMTNRELGRRGSIRD